MIKRPAVSMDPTTINPVYDVGATVCRAKKASRQDVIPNGSTIFLINNSDEEHTPLTKPRASVT
jgi:hypothetical protein